MNLADKILSPGEAAEIVRANAVAQDEFARWAVEVAMQGWASDGHVKSLDTILDNVLKAHAKAASRREVAHD